MREYAPPGTRLLLASAFVSTVPMGYLLVVLPLCLVRSGIEPAFIGLLYTVSGLVTSLIVAFSGVFADRWGRRRFIVAGTLLPVPSYLVFAATTEPAWLIAASILGGVGLANGAAGALTISSFDALLAEKASAAQRTRVFAASQALWSLALADGSIAAAVPTLLRTSFGVGDLESYRLPYLAMAVLTAAAAALLSRCARTRACAPLGSPRAGCRADHARRSRRTRSASASSDSASASPCSCSRCGSACALASPRPTSVPGTRRPNCCLSRQSRSCRSSSDGSADRARCSSRCRRAAPVSL